MNIEENWSCICKKNNNVNMSQYDHIQCKSCGVKAHSTCFELYSKEAKANFLCIECRLVENNPFYDSFHSLINPICIFPSNQVIREIPFRMSPSDFQSIQEKNLSIIAVLFKVVYEFPKFIEAPSVSISLSINNKPLQLFPRRECNLDSHIVEGGNLLCLNIEKLPSKCILGIFACRRVELKDIAKKILTMNGSPQVEEAKKNCESIRFKEFEVFAGFPVRDPITNNLLQFAARGKKCDHLQCFDLLNFLKFYQVPSSEYFKCFCCKKLIPWKELWVDQYVYSILKEIKAKYTAEEIEDVEHISFNEKGEWMLQQEFTKEWEQNFEQTREKRLKERNERMERMEIEKETQTNKKKPDNLPAKPTTELTLEEAIGWYTTFQKQSNHLLNSEQINENVALKLKEFKTLKFFTPQKIYEFFEKTKMLLGCSLPGIFSSSDEKIMFYQLEELGEMIYKKKLNSIIPIAFAWATNYDELIVLTLLIMTKNKRNDPDFCLAMELLLCFSWFMEKKKISLEGVLKQTIYQLYGKFINYFGEKLNWKVEQYALLMATLKKTIPNLHVPSMIPKKFSQESERIFSNQAEFISNMMKNFSLTDLVEFVKLVYKPPVDKIFPEEEKILKYVFYYFMLICQKHQPSVMDNQILWFFGKWDRYQKVTPILLSEKITPSNIKSYL